ncbi:GDSL esterase/lipase 7 [Prunus yedoensis var. nudiflora]|uniref:GDSL esterase/lipase 7 n=1 Tax=Prunus yedoensis var. nudiflora TaxID=2094558 RepID=A0A314UPK8_PRUYE|nr:GDSL esterase/lipase 7 [Prunus yedoensis var. nudiflora]
MLQNLRMKPIGNNNFLPTVSVADYLPYGVNFVKGVTGRFTNGRTAADLIGEMLESKRPDRFVSKNGEVRLARTVPNPHDLLQYLSKSIFLFSIGSNDFIINYLAPKRSIQANATLLNNLHNS